MAACLEEVALAALHAQLATQLPPLKLMKSITDRQAGGVVAAAAASIGTPREDEAGQLCVILYYSLSSIFDAPTFTWIERAIHGLLRKVRIHTGLRNPWIVPIHCLRIT